MMKKLYHYVEQINNYFWARVARSTLIEESSLGIFRWIFGFFLLLFLVPQFSWIGEIPNAFFDPPYFSLANLFTQFPGDLFFKTIDLLIIISIVCLTIGVKARLFSSTFLICWFVGNNFQYSFGKIDHGIMILALLLCMIFSNWGTYYALIADRPLSRNCSKQALALFSVLLAFGFFTAGFAKALNWIDFDFSTNGFLSWFYPGYYDLSRTALLAPTILSLPKWIFEFFDYAAVIFELSAFIALLNSRKWWIFWLFIACLFHLSNTLLLNIPFVNHFLVYLVFVDFSRLKTRIWGTVNPSVPQKIIYLMTGLTICLAFPYFIGIISGETFKFFPNTMLYVSVFIWIVGASIIFSDLLFIKNQIAIKRIKLNKHNMKKSLKSKT
ncbi:MAG: hypothetical protein AB4368_20430 [Xenococcaceae cyanobacterium]